jgi:hypothetical protein
MKACLIHCDSDRQYLHGVLGLRWDKEFPFWNRDSRPEFNVIWIVGRKLKFSCGFHRSYPINALLRDEGGRFLDTGVPHIITLNQSPIIVCLPCPLKDSAFYKTDESVEEVKTFVSLTFKAVKESLCI